MVRLWLDAPVFAGNNHSQSILTAGEVSANLASHKPNLHPNYQWLVGEVDMEKEGSIETQSSMKKVIFYATVISGFIAAYMMYRRGESLGAIAKQTITNPVGSLVSEVKNTV
jgi:hypothetical protein